MKLTHRERVARAVARQEIDRTAMRYNGRKEVDEPLAQHLGIPLEARWHERLMRTLGIDVRNLYVEPTIASSDPAKKEAWKRGPRSVDEVDAIWLESLQVKHRNFAGLPERVKALDADGDPPWISITTNAIFTDTTKLLGVEETLLRLASDDEVVPATFTRFGDFLCEYVDCTAAALGDRLDMFYVGDDLGTQTSTFISPAAIQKHLMPHYKRIGERIHAAGAKFCFHCCGAIHDIIPMFIAAGVDIINPIQPCADSMQPEVLHRDFGDKIIFCGGIDEQHLLPFGTPHEVAATVKRYIDVLGGPRGGYILDSANILHTDDPPANIAAMFKVAREYQFR